jgi:hypothetical protein
MASVAQKLMKRGGGYIRCEDTVSLPVTATANTDFTYTFPPGALNASYRTLTTTAYTAVTDAQISIGSTAGGVDYVAAVSIKAIGVVAHTNVNAAAATHLNPGGATINIRVAQSGGSTAVGAATLVIGYAMPVS